MTQLIEGPARQGDLLVLASGGIDSSCLLHMATQQGLKPTALFVDYGQAAAEAEYEAITKICNSLGTPWRRVQFHGAQFGAGEIRGRNAFLMHVALLEFPSSSGVVALGIHAGTGYLDCSPEFLTIIARSYELHTGGAITAAAPFLHWAKQEVYGLVSKLQVPVGFTHSCEASNLPCGRCNSCLDRNLLEGARNPC